jgi:hypothetical protein
MSLVSHWGLSLGDTGKIVSIRKEGPKWLAYDGEKVVAKAECGHCVIEAIKRLTRNSHTYRSIHVTNIDGTTTIIPTGADKW